jgi:DNA-binding PadR family transcriptional regulator
MDRQLLLLGLLRRQDMHGYQLNEFIEERMHFCIDLKKPTAYYILDKMAKEGLVSVEEEQAGNRPPRRVYQVTPAGEGRFLELLQENLAQHQRTYYPSDVGLAFMDQLPSEKAAGLLRKKSEGIRKELKDLEKATGHTGPLWHVLERNQRLLKAELAWLEELLNDLDRR